jgi:hypothetical protein
MARYCVFFRVWTEVLTAAHSEEPRLQKFKDYTSTGLHGLHKERKII